MVPKNTYIPSFEIPLADISADWRECSKIFFANLGYRIKEEGKNSIVFKAGSKLWTILSLNPANCLREACLSEENGVLKFQIATSMKIHRMSESDAIYINWEAESFIAFLTGLTNESPSPPKTWLLIAQSIAAIAKNLALNVIITVAIMLFAIYGIRGGIYLVEKIIAQTSGVSQIDLNEYMGNDKQVQIGAADVYLMPFKGFPEPLAKALASKLSQDLNINVRTAAALPLPEGIYNNKRQQYDAYGFYKPQIDAACTLGDLKVNTVFIGLVRGSIYMPDTPHRFLFAVQFDPKFAVVGDSEMRGMAIPENLYHTRLYKMVKRQIGKTYYDKKPTSSPFSLMKSPLNNTFELDALGMEF